MNKRMRELQALIASKTAEAKGFMDGENKDIVKANTILDEVDTLQKEFDTEERILKASKAGVPAEPATPAAEPAVDSIKAFADAARNGFKAAMNEGTPAEGGYTVPDDISTKINKFKENHFSLRNYIDHETVSTNAGSRTYQTRAQQTGFAQVGEGGKIGQTAAPQFTRINYAIKKYAGYLPVTNELLADSDAAIANVIMEWLAGESVATENAQILAKVNAVEATAFTGIKDIKKAVNVTLSAFKGALAIYTNDDGVQYLDTLEDKNGRPLLAPDPAKPMELRLSVGARSIPVVQIPNEVLATAEGGKVPFIVADLKEFLKEFDRQQLTVAQSTTAAVTGFNAFEEDMTLFRGILRADFVVKDAKALVRGEITVTA
jgi:HK97 family phage major capsid protein